MGQLKKPRGGVLAFLSALALGAWGAAAQASTPPHSGQMVDIGGRRMHVICRGPRSDTPLVLLDAGMYGEAAAWDAVQASLESEGLRSCAFDRAGMGLSDAGPQPRDAQAMVGDLEALLTALNEPGPYILVAHSLAGIQAHLFAVKDRARLAALVLVDATSPEIADTPEGRELIERYRPFAHAMAVLDGLGVLRLTAARSADQVGLKGEAHDEIVYVFRTERHQKTSREELLALGASVDEARAAGPLDPDLPVIAIESGEGKGDPVWSADREAEAWKSRAGRAVKLDDASHPGLLDPDHAPALAGAIKTLIETSTTP